MIQVTDEVCSLRESGKYTGYLLCEIPRNFLAPLRSPQDEPQVSALAGRARDPICHPAQASGRSDSRQDAQNLATPAQSHATW